MNILSFGGGVDSSVILIHHPRGVEVMMNKEQRADARQNGSYYIVNLKDRDDPFAEWFESDIDGTYDQCDAEVADMSLHDHFHIQIIEG